LTSLSATSPHITALPIASSSTNRSTPRSTFLSRPIRSSQRPTGMRGGSIGSCAAATSRARRCVSGGGKAQARSDSLAAQTSPAATASPCSHAP
jgi:hypothetical protein